MSIASDLIRGHTDALILSVLMRADSYGYEINKRIFSASSGAYELKEATLYTAFKRLEETGAVVSYWGDQDAGARRKYYHITLAGQKTYRRMVDEWREARTIINALLDEGEGK